MIWTPKGERDETQWHTVFLWWPVRLVDKRKAWLCRVERLCVGLTVDGRLYEYKEGNYYDGC